MGGLIFGNMLFFLCLSLSGSVVLFGAVQVCHKKNNIVDYIGSNIIMLIDLVGITWFVLRGVSYIVFGIKEAQPGLVFAFAASILQIGLTIPAIYCINRWVPFIVGRPTRQTLKKHHEMVTSERHRIG